MTGDLWDILVVGGGPSGLFAAEAACRMGARVLILEEHEEIGRPVHCAGLIGAEGFLRLGFTSGADLVVNELSKARFHSPSGLMFTVSGKKAYVVDRDRLDRRIALLAQGEGAVIKPSSRVDSLVFEGGPVAGVRVSTGESIRSRIVIDGEGMSCTLLKRAGLETPRLSGFIPACQLEVEEAEVERDHVDLFFGASVAPGFFAWVIPTGDSSARVGLACNRGNPWDLLVEFVRKHFKGKAVARSSGCIYTAAPSRKTSLGGLLVVGDAAGHVKATTGGGVVMGGLCAKMAGRVAAESVLRGDGSAGFLEKYDRIWRASVGQELSRMALARKVACSLPDQTVDRLFRAVIDGELVSEIEMSGDIDFQGRTLANLVLSPRMFLTYLSEAPALLSSLFLGRARQ